MGVAARIGLAISASRAAGGITALKIARGCSPSSPACAESWKTALDRVVLPAMVLTARDDGAEDPAVRVERRRAAAAITHPLPRVRQRQRRGPAHDHRQRVLKVAALSAQSARVHVIVTVIALLLLVGGRDVMHAEGTEPAFPVQVGVPAHYGRRTTSTEDPIPWSAKAGHRALMSIDFMSMNHVAASAPAWAGQHVDDLPDAAFMCCTYVSARIHVHIGRAAHADTADRPDNAQPQAHACAAGAGADAGACAGSGPHARTHHRRRQRRSRAHAHAVAADACAGARADALSPPRLRRIRAHAHAVAADACAGARAHTLSPPVTEPPMPSEPSNDLVTPLPPPTPTNARLAASVVNHPDDAPHVKSDRRRQRCR